MPKTPRELVNELKDRHGMTESAIAFKVGVSQPTIHRIGTGETQKVSYFLADSLFRLLMDMEAQ